MNVRETIAPVIVLLAWVPRASALNRLSRCPTYRGRIDHLSLHVVGQRQFVSVLGNDTPKSRGIAEDSADARRLS